MNLYKIKTKFLGKDLNKEATLEYIAATNSKEVYDYINKKHFEGEWPDASDMKREEIIKEKGDFNADYMGEFYDQKYGWEALKEITSEDVETLKRLKILE